MTIFDEDNPYEIDCDSYMADIFKPGQNYLSDGKRGGGKTHTVIAFAWGLVNGIWPKCGNFVVITNVIFFKRIKKTPGNPRSDFDDTQYPPKVYRAFSMEELFRTISRLWAENPKKDIKFLVILDEAQNFFNSYDARSPVSSALQKWFGTLRKFNICLWMMTPTRENVPPKGRNFDDDPKHAGYLAASWNKNKKETLESLNANRMEYDDPDIAFKQWAKIKFSYDDQIKRYFKIPITPWNKLREDLEVGEFCYDHESSADFTMGSEDFSFTELINRCSQVSSLRIDEALAGYFDDLDNGLTGGEDDPEAANNRQRALDKFLILKEMDKDGVSERKEASYFGYPKTTFRRFKENLYNSFADTYLSEEEAEKIEKAKKHKGKAKKLEEFDNDETIERLDQEIVSQHSGPWSRTNQKSSDIYIS